MNIEILLGKTTEHLMELEGTKFYLHKNVLHDFLRLQREALADGFNLQIASAFRDYNRQLLIWNAKAKGERPILDEHGLPLDYKSMSPQQIVHAILRWSAIPGCSRHHWGTDLDVYDGNTQKPEEVKLVPSECEKGGPAAALHEWLDGKISQNAAFGFFRPYATDRKGIAPERWHISHYPSSRRLIQDYTFSLFRRSMENSEIEFKDILVQEADALFHEYFLNFDIP